jgi:hypothetical protein
MSTQQPKKALSAVNGSRAKNSHERVSYGGPQPKISKKVLECLMAENKPKRVRRALVLVALTLLTLFVVACGGSADSNACPHRTHQVTDAAGNVTMVDNTPAEDQQVCDYLAYLNAHVHSGVVDCDARKGVTGGQCGEAGAGGSP